MKHNSKSILRGIGLQFFAMENLDVIKQKRDAILQRMAEAAKDNDTESFQQAFSDLAESIQESVRGEFREVQARQDDSILASRGCRVLTSVEQKYYDSLIGAMKSENPKQALTGINTVLPETVIDTVFEDMRANHPLLSAINFQSTGALVKILLSTTGGKAQWGPVDSSFLGELSANFLELDLSLAILTAILPVNMYMLDLGPAWLDRYVRELLSEALAVELEVGIVAGNGKDQPIGMCKKLTGAVDGVYSDKQTVPITDLSPETYGKLLDTLSKGPNSKSRSISNVVLIVNPGDYFTKVFPATTVRATDGTYSKDVFPFPTTIIQSAAVPAGKAIMGLAPKYFMGVGTQSGGKIEFTDEAKWVERIRMYGIFLYGYGRALDENAFVYLDISGLKPAAVQVEVVSNTPAAG